MDRKKKHRLFRFVVLLLLLSCWVVMMFFPAYMDTMRFRAFLLVTFACATAYSIYRKTYFPNEEGSKTGKMTAAVFSVALLVRLLFF